MTENSDSESDAFVASALGAAKAFGERFTIYVPNKGRAPVETDKQVELADWDTWVRRALDVLGKINGGATAAAPANGLYIDTERNNEEVWERTVLVYSYIDRDAFRERIGEVRMFVHELGQNTNQGCVFFEFDGFAYRIDPPYDVMD